MWSRAPCGGVFYPSNWTLGETAWIGLAHCSSCFSLIWGTVLWPQDCDFSFIFQNIFKVCIPFFGHWLVLCNRKSQLFFFLTDIIKLQELGIYGVLRPGAVCSVSPTFLARSFPIPQQLSFLGPLYSQNEHQ